MNPLTPGFLEDMTNDQFLLCDEVWDMSPVSSSVHDHHITYNHTDYYSKHDGFEHLFDTYLQKETKYMIRPGYINVLESDHFVANCRFKAIQWFIHSQRRFNFGIGTVFNAVNYADRFIDINHCHGWTYWMMELLSLASLSIAIKFGETCPPSLHEIQVGNLILSPLTRSYAELITQELNAVIKPINLNELSSRICEVLLASSHDVKLLVYRPCVIAMSGMRCVLEDQECISQITNLIIPSDQEKNLQSCYKTMQEILVKIRKFEGNTNPSSPDTVLNKEQAVIYEEHVDLSFINGHVMKNNSKRN